MRKPFYSVVTNKGATSGRIDIYGIIGDPAWNDGVEGKRFVRDFTILETQYDRIDIHINSPGGSIWDGLPIFNAILASKKDTHTYVDGIAFSMGFIILLAGKTVHGPKTSMLMAHNAGGIARGNAKEMRATADMLDKHDDVLCQIIADKTGKTTEQVKALWMNMDDNFITGQEAFDFKLIDVLEDYAPKEMPENPQNLTIHQVAAFYNERMEDKNSLSNNQNQNSNMKFLKIEALAGVVAPTDEQLVQANADLTVAGVTGATIVAESMITDAAAVTAERDGLVTANATLTNDLSVANSALTTAQNAVTTAEAAVSSEKAAHEATKALLTAAQNRIAKGPGAVHAKTAGEDAPVDATAEEAELQAQLDALPHNQNADKLIG